MGQWSRRASRSSGILGSLEVSADILELIGKNARASISTRVQIQSAGSPTRSESSRSGIRNMKFRSDLMEEVKHYSVLEQLPKRSKPGIYPYTPSKTCNSVAITTRR
ncbi:hypothetical protein EVAR_79263_1 [Eumeta japonica]|uniref:Uncharacterized protein n=1 Tax=Eumeta variegata TaxID=151549 RepID=A0A4C1TFD1_EUMVA|nr:hypothetical protein EVAR_79263_1 [Eumeta japonica]